MQRFTGERIVVTRWSPTIGGEGNFGISYAVAVDAAGNVYVFNTDQDQIRTFAPV